MSYLEIALAIQGRLRLLEGVDLALDPNLPTETSNRPLVALTSIEVGPERPTAGGLRTQSFEADGLAEVSIRWPRDVGMGQPWDLVDQIGDVAVGAVEDTGGCFRGIQAYTQENDDAKFFEVRVAIHWESTTTRARVPPGQFVEPDFVDPDFVGKEAPS